MKRDMTPQSPAKLKINTRNKPYGLWEANPQRNCQAKIKPNYDIIQMFTNMKVSAKSDRLQGLVGNDKSFKSVNTNRLQLFGNSFKIIAFCLKYCHISALTIFGID